jgi:hypothetical protein
MANAAARQQGLLLIKEAFSQVCICSATMRKAVTSVPNVIYIRVREVQVELRLVFLLWRGRLAFVSGNWGLNPVLIRWWLEGGLISAACDGERLSVSSCFTSMQYRYSMVISFGRSG